MSDDGVIIDFTYDERPFTLSRAPFDPKPPPGRSGQTWHLRGDGALLGSFACTDEGLPSVLEELVAGFKDDETAPWRLMLIEAVAAVRSYLEMHPA